MFSYFLLFYIMFSYFLLFFIHYVLRLEIQVDDVTVVQVFYLAGIELFGKLSTKYEITPWQI